MEVKQSAFSLPHQSTGTLTLDYRQRESERGHQNLVITTIRVSVAGSLITLETTAVAGGSPLYGLQLL
ncbi:MAG: hypothetical protein ABI206_08530 [Antricoccus sp.]